MSTWIYLRCEDHNPPLVAQDESGQHLYDLPQIRDDIANRELLIAASDHDMAMEDYFRRNSLGFLTAHPKCHIGIVDEYGREHATTDAEATS